MWNKKNAKTSFLSCQQLKTVGNTNGFNCFLWTDTLLLDYCAFSKRFCLISERDKTAINFEKQGETLTQYIKSHMNGERQGYVVCCGITQIVKGSNRKYETTATRDLGKWCWETLILKIYTRETNRDV